LKIGCFSQLKWSVPGDRIAEDNNWVRGWARDPGPKARETLSDWKWLWPWLKKHLAREKLMLILFFCGIALMAPSMRRGDSGPAKISPILIPVFICAAGIAFWFIAAPDPRFGYGFLFSFVLLFFCQGAISSQLLQKLTKFLSQHAGYVSVAGLAAGTSSLASLFLAAIALRRLSMISPAFWILVGVLLVNSEPAQRVLQVENWNQWSHFEEPRVAIQKTYSGLDLYTAQGECMCGDAPLPCTQYFDPRLRAFKFNDGKFRMFWLSEK
jgi:hypothetical protein